MTNTRVYCLSLALLGCLVSCLGAPVVSEETVYDQRQNGSENFRVHVNGVVIVHAPLEALVALASLSDDSGLQQQLLEILGSAGGNATEEPTVLAPTSTTPISTTTSAAAEESTSAAAITADAVAASNSTTAAPEKTEESIKPHKKTKQRLRIASLLMPFFRRL